MDRQWRQLLSSLKWQLRTIIKSEVYTNVNVTIREKVLSLIFFDLWLQSSNLIISQLWRKLIGYSPSRVRNTAIWLVIYNHVSKQIYASFSPPKLRPLINALMHQYMFTTDDILTILYKKNTSK